MEKALRIPTGQTHGQIDTTFLVLHRRPLEEAAMGYKDFRDNRDE